MWMKGKMLVKAQSIVLQKMLEVSTHSTLEATPHTFNSITFYLLFLLYSNYNSPSIREHFSNSICFIRAAVLLN